MRFVIDSYSPIMMGAIRFTAAGLILFVILRALNYPNPTLHEWKGAGLVGFLMLVIGNPSMAYAEKTVSSSVGALAIATVPILMAIFSGFWRQWPTKREWCGILIGTTGVAILATGSDMQASPIGAALMLVSATTWALGSVWSKYLPMPKGAMASAAQMLAGGIMLVLICLVRQEPLPALPTARSVWALAYLIVFGSLIAYSAYLYLLQNVRPALATSNTFVNPLVAIGLGVWLADEKIGVSEYTALVVILLGVLLVLPFWQTNKTPN